MPGVKVVYTRTSDKALASTKIEDLQKRADIANKAEGDLFLSVHVNAAKSTSAKGVETLIMGETPKEQQYNTNALFESNRDDLLDMSNEKEAAIIRAYIQNLQFTYGEYSEMLARLVQDEYVKLGYTSRGVRRQPLKVLYATDMPSVLTEIGFMSNPADLKHITSEKGQKEIAGAIFRAVKRYIENVNRALLIDSGTTAPTPQPQKAAKEVKEEVKHKPQPQTKPKPQATVKRYAIQLMASVKKIPTNHPELKSYRGKVWILESAGSSLRYKYCHGSFADKATAQKHIEEVRKEFPQAFIITYDK
jgi:N-acetylmuramoyl-L-alanine amidase